jgi:Asp-tRNA(Asn)/Glu-tRNA(Gln) amidotransferase A subunit family amidase
VGYLKEAFEKEQRGRENDQKVLDVLKSLGLTLVPIKLPEIPVIAMHIILNAEAAAAFDDLTRSGRDDLLVRQDKFSWPNSFRQARFIPAVEYIQADRLRTVLMGKMAALMTQVDVYIAPNRGSSNLLITNLTGHPQVAVPNGFNAKGHPTSISFVGKLFGEARLLRVVKAYQDATDFHQKHPDLDKNIRDFLKKAEQSDSAPPKK